MVTFVLVHGGNLSAETWNRLRQRNDYPPGVLLGGLYWGGTVAYLKAHGHGAVAPTLPDEHTHDLTDHVEGICRIVEKNDLKGIILVGHSYGGMVITGVADRMGKRIRRLVYVDAALPDPGQSLVDQFAAGGVDPRSFTGFEPASAYLEKIRFDPRRLGRLPGSYILCTKSEYAAVTRIARGKVAAQYPGWSYYELPAPHVPMATMPERFNRMILGFAYR